MCVCVCIYIYIYIYMHTHIYIQVFAHHRHVEQLWHKGKVKLHQRLGLRLFQQDVKQVSRL